MIYWLASALTVAAILLLRLAGRKSISQMTFGTVVVMISIGNLIVQPVTRNNPWIALGTTTAMLATLVVVEWLQVRFDAFENFFSGKAVTVIANGQIEKKHLKKLRLPVDKLEMRLRQKGIKRISDIKTATMEVNGDIGYELQPGAEPLTVAQFETAMQKLIPEIRKILTEDKSVEPNMFDEINHSVHRTHHRELQ